jgi:hypothetical protein
MCYKGYNKKQQFREKMRILKVVESSDCSLKAYEREVGIASNRIEERYGESYIWSCTHRPSRLGGNYSLV